MQSNKPDDILQKVLSLQTENEDSSTACENNIYKYAKMLIKERNILNQLIAASDIQLVLNRDKIHSTKKVSSRLALFDITREMFNQNCSFKM